MSAQSAFTTLRQLHPAEPIMTLAVGTEGANAVITVHGEMDMSTTSLITEMAEHVLLRRPNRLIMDLAGVTFFGAHGISALLHVQSVTARAQVGFTVRNPAPRVSYLLAVTDVLRHLDRVEHPGAVSGLVRSGRDHGGEQQSRCDDLDDAHLLR